MNGKHHFSFSLYLFLFLIALLHFKAGYGRTQIEEFGFWYLLVIIYLNPDADTYSFISNNLGIFKYIFLPLHHRTISHSLIAWGFVGVVFVYAGWSSEAIGLVSASYVHIVPDRIGTGCKKVWHKVTPW
jgi:uncharacterized metal-binding protein